LIASTWSRNVKKGEMTTGIINTFNNNKAYKLLHKSRSVTSNNPPKKEAPRKEAQCSYRLLNKLFLDEFLELLSNVGNAAFSGAVLDIGKTSHDEGFWKKTPGSLP
jgi:hypothetical protein